jgi:hypothetical protein
MDVLVVGPALIALGMQSRNRETQATLLLTGAATMTYNGVNYWRNR